MSEELRADAQTGREEFLVLAESCGARLTGKPDGSESITVIFTIDAWRKFDAALARSTQAAPADEFERGRQQGMPVGTLTISMFRGHLENRDFDYFGSLPEGSHTLYATPPQEAAPASQEGAP